VFLKKKYFGFKDMSAFGYVYYFFKGVIYRRRLVYYFKKLEYIALYYLFVSFVSIYTYSIHFIILVVLTFLDTFLLLCI
jgi:hypothetical protein